MGVEDIRIGRMRRRALLLRRLDAEPLFDRGDALRKALDLAALAELCPGLRGVIALELLGPAVETGQRNPTGCRGNLFARLAR